MSDMSIDSFRGLSKRESKWARGVAKVKRVGAALVASGAYVVRCETYDRRI